MQKFIYYSSGSSLHNRIFLDYFFKEENFDFIFVHSDLKPKNYESISDEKYSKTPLKYALSHPLKIFTFLIYGTKKAIRLNGIYRRADTLKRITKEENISFIYSQQLIEASVIAYLSKTPYVISIWGSDFNVIRHQKWIKSITKRTLENALLIHASSQRQKNILIKEGYNKEKIFVQHLGVKINEFQPKESKSILKERFGYKEKKILIYSRGHTETYQPQKLLSLVALINKKVSNLLLIIAGESSFIPALKEFVKQLDIEKSVHFTGFIQPDQYIPYIQMADIFIQTPLHDGVSIAVMEALASGTPVISTDVGDTSTNVVDGLNGLLMDPEKINDYVTNIIDLLNDDKKLEELSKNSLEWAEKNCDRDMAMRNIIQHLKTVKF